MTRRKVTTRTLQEMKLKGERIAVVTAYDATLATLLDAAGVDVLMVGDSLGMVIQGAANTLSVTLEEMTYHCRAVQRARPKAHVVCDLPFMTYQVGAEDALRSAGVLVQKGGAEAVKLEGGRRVAASVAGIVAAGIPVMGHIGLTPQSVHHFGGFRVQGRTGAEARQLLDDAKSLQDAGVYAIVIEGVPSDVATQISAGLDVPTIGIGAGAGTDGQVLVSYDLLGLYDGVKPKFVKRFAELGAEVRAATERYVSEVRAGTFPDAEHSFAMDPGEVLGDLPADSSGGEA